MESRHIRVPTLDDMTRHVASAIKEHGIKVDASRGRTQEIAGVLLELTNPRARLSRSATRGKIFSALGELLWYLSGESDLEFIKHYIPNYTNHGDEYGAYGPRIFNLSGHNQFENVISLLRERKTTRRANIQIFRSKDINKDRKDIPCTCNIQFMIRNGEMNTITYMRSNDAYMGLVHDVFSFTMIQEIVARILGVNVGSYLHNVGSLHLYERNSEEVKKYMDEGWHSTEEAMPPMPEGDPRPSIKAMLEAESEVRRKESLNHDVAEDKNLDDYWLDLIRLLQIYRYTKENNLEGIERLGQKLRSQVYSVFVDSAIRKVS